MKELLTGITPGNNLGCPNCGCGGDSCGADGCICCHQDCYDVTVRDATPSGFGDEFGEWFRISTDPLSVVAAEPVRFGLQVQVQGRELEAMLPVSTDDDPSMQFGYAWIEFHGKAGLVRYYATLQEPSKMGLRFYPGQGWAFAVTDSACLWLEEPAYTWRFVAMKKGDKEVLVELEGTVQA